MVIGEATLCGKPVIATNVVSREDVPDYCGYIAKAGDTESLTQVILRACDEKGKFSTEQIRNFGISRFAKSAVIQQIFTIMSRIVQKNAKP